MSGADASPFDDTSFEATLWQVLAGTAGGPNRASILRTIAERPRNANQIADALDLDYKTVRHHLDVLREKDMVRRGGDGYGAVYLRTDRLKRRWDTAEDIIDRVTDR